MPAEGNEMSAASLGATQAPESLDALVIAGVELRSRLFLGTGKYHDDGEMLGALEASGCELVTVALRRLDLDDPSKKTILDVVDWQHYRVLPNTAGCPTAAEAIRIARLARSMGLSDWVKLEVIPDPRYLLPDPVETLAAAETLVKEGFTVLPYINADPILATRLQEVGCATVMPLGSSMLASDRPVTLPWPWSSAQTPSLSTPPWPLPGSRC